MQYMTALSFISTLLLIVSTGSTETSVDSKAADNNALSGSKSIFQATLGTTNVGRFKYQDGEVILSQNQQKSTDFFFTPFPHIEPNLTECNYNEFSGYTELILSVSLYTPSLLDSIKHFIKQHHNICRAEYCDVSLLPMHSIRLFQKGLRTTDSRNKYTLDDGWYSNTQLRQSIEFIVYTSNMSVCENVRDMIASHCRFSNFEVHYLLHGQQTIARKLEIHTEHITGTTMYNQIQSRFPSANHDSVALTGNDYRNLLTEIKDQITLNLRVEEGYEGLQDPVAIDKILERQLQHKQVQLKAADNQLWDSLYWTSEQTRPDKLSKILNKIIKKDSTDSDTFRYDHSQAEEAMKQNLQLHEKQKLENLKKQLAGQSQYIQRTSDVDTHVGLETGGGFLNIGSLNTKINAGVGVNSQNTNISSSLSDSLTQSKNDSDRLNSRENERQHGATQTMERKDAEKLINYLSDHVQLEGEIIRPKPIDVTIVKFGSLKSNTKLFSNSVLIKTRTDIHILPLRCPYESPQSPTIITRLQDKYDRLARVVDNFRSVFTALYEKSKTDFNQNLGESNNRCKASMKLLETRMMEKFAQTENATNAIINETVNQLWRSQTATTIPTTTRSSSLSSRICTTATWDPIGITVAGGLGKGSQLNQLSGPEGVFVSDDDIIYVADSGNSRVMTWLRGISTGRVVAGGNGRGSQTDQLRHPYKVIVDKNETMFICDEANRRVQRWHKNDPHGETILSNIYCAGLTMDNRGSLYVSDTDRQHVLKWPSSEVVAGGNGYGNAFNQLAHPRSVFVDDDLSVFVVEENNDRVTKWPVNAKEGTIVAGGHGEGNGNHQLNNPSSVVVDRMGTVYVADMKNYRVMRWLKSSKTGTVIIGEQDVKNKLEQRNYPTDLAFDRNGNLYLADKHNHRIQMFMINKTSCATMQI